MANSEPEKAQHALRQNLRDVIAGHFIAQAAYVAVQLDIATRLADGAKTCDEMAGVTKTHAPTLRRLLRALASYNIFAEDGQGRFSNTEASTLLRSDVEASMRPLALFYRDEFMLQPWQALMHSVVTGESAFEHVHGMHSFDYLARHPLEAKVFDNAMVSASGAINSLIATVYDFSPIGRLVDVAGGFGSTLCTILKANPRLRGVLFDMPHVAEGARRFIEEAGVADRCVAQAGNFFESVPEGADAYFMKYIIHDWDDERCIRILSNCHAAIRPGGKLLVCERIIPAGNERSFAKITDLTMLVMTPGGRERTEQEYRDLFAAGGFRLERVIPAGPEHSIMECLKR